MKPSRRSFVIRAAGLGGLIAGGVLGRSAVADEPDEPDAAPPTALVAGSLQGVAEGLGGATVEAHGSVAARQLVVDGAREPDALALADPRLFAGLADRVTLFATNALVLAYTESSSYAPALRRDWAAAIQAPGIDVGRTDPDLDPLGYRTVMALDLAAAHGVDADAVRERTLVFPETALMRTLETGDLDAAFAYRNMAVEHDLPYVDLPTAIDFSAPARREHYASVTVDLANRTVRGAPIVYAAAALTERGEPWVRALSGATDRLATAGFGQPEGLPTDVALADLDWPR